MMKIKDVKIGSKFKFGQIEFVKLDNTHSVFLCLATDVMFGDCFDQNNLIIWTTTTLRQKLMEVIGDYISDNLHKFLAEC